MTTEVIELMPGTGGYRGDTQSRLDWSPIAQPPGRDGVMAHTPDPTAYHRSADGRTILPRATKHGASRAFDSDRPGLLNVDPTDPLTGRGGTIIDVELLRKDEDLLQRASAMAEGDPAIAWDLITQGRAEVERGDMRGDAPPMTGYVVPNSRPGGQQVTGAGHYGAGILSPGTTLAGAAVQPVSADSMRNPAIHHKENIVEPPRLVPSTPPLPAASQAPAPAQPPVQMAQPAQQPAPTPQPPPAAAVDPSQQLILQTLQGLTEAVSRMAAPAPAPAQPVLSEPPLTRADFAQATESRKEVEVLVPAAEQETCDKPSPERQMDTHIFGLGFLQPTPQRPTIKVVFDLGMGGQHLKRFHHVVFTDSLIVLIYDDRYEGDRFHPPATKPGEPIHVMFPDRDETYTVLVPPSPRLNFDLGCLDFLELVITKESTQKAEVSQEEMTDLELADWRDEIPTRWSQDDSQLEQAIRAGRFDAGGAL